jgi:Ca2+-transporting ATPase
LLRHLEAGDPTGLAESQVAARQAQHGPNALSEAPPEPLWKKFLAQFNELVVWILIAAAVISGVLGDLADMAAILAIILLNGVIGFLQEHRAEKALAALAKLSAPTARVRRSGQTVVIPATQLVPGDRIEIEAGDCIPADARMVSGFGLRVQEASLTGESVPVEKAPADGLTAETSLGDRVNMLFMSTVVAAGKAEAVVTETGMQTELGKIAGLLQRQEAEPTPLQRRLGELGKILVIGCLSIVVVVFLLEFRRTGNVLDVLVRSISLAVAAVPEGLPAVVTMALALGLRRMVQRNVLIRRLPSVETLGSVTVICSDKTGTLTRNEMTVRALYTGQQWVRVSGGGYAPHGEFRRLDPQAPAAETGLLIDPRQDGPLHKSLEVALRCNNARVEPMPTDNQKWRVIGDPTEGALLVAALKGGQSLATAEGKVVFEIPFDSDRKAMSVVTQTPDGRRWMFTKGAPEVILGLCDRELLADGEVSLAPDNKGQILQAASQMASQALRVLALAYREVAPDEHREPREERLVFAGLAGMIDPPREEVALSIASCRSAGIRPVMITGDHPDTATAVARELKLAGPNDQTIDGNRLDAMSDAELARQVDHIAVYARVSPEHKLRVVQAWKSRGQVVAMTGDGVNDAPAVKSADIGVAMGITGTDVTKEASDMVLTDDNFTSIVNAVEEGRGIFDNIQKFIHFLLSCNTGEVLLMFISALFSLPSPLQPIQLLWINLVTDGLPALALAMEKPERDIMQRPPRPPRESVITLSRGLLILLHGTLIAGVCLIGYLWARSAHPEDPQRAQTITFCIAAFSQLLYAFACRSHHHSVPEIGLFTNPHLLGAIVVSALLQFAVVTLPGGDRVFETAPLAGHDWLLIAILSFIPVSLIELAKLVRTGYAWWGGRTAAH